MLITIEGVDCSGKETQSNILVERLRNEGKTVAKFSFPFYSSPTGRIVGRPYLGKDNNSYFEEGASHVDPYVASLYFAADRKYNQKIIEDAIKNYDYVILDRYIYSNMAHQGCKLSEAEQDDFFKFISQLEFDLLKLPKPDVAFFLYLPVELVRILKQNRKERPDDHEKDENYLHNAEKTYLKLEKECDFTRVNCYKDGNIKNVNEIADEIYSHIKNER